MKENLKKMLYVLVMFISVIGLVGGIGVAVASKQYFIACAVLVLGGMAFPTAKSMFKSLSASE